MATRILLRFALAVALVACTDATAPTVVGAWGGDHVRLDVRHDLTPGISSGGTAEFDCAHGTLMGWIDPDKSGAFDVPGMYVQEHGGPSYLGEQLPTWQVRYRGVVNGSRMTLSVSRTDTTWTIGPFTLDRGRTTGVFKCL
jgi:hypothetical protein